MLTTFFPVALELRAPNRPLRRPRSRRVLSRQRWLAVVSRFDEKNDFFEKSGLEKWTRHMGPRHGKANPSTPGEASERNR
jgi:hypothetical protein